MERLEATQHADRERERRIERHPAAVVAGNVKHSVKD